MVLPDAFAFWLWGCPSSVCKAALRDRVSAAFGDITPDDVLIHSLATAPWERPPTKTATLQFTTLPSVIDTVKKEWKVEGRDLGTLLLDTHFLGLTPLNEIRAWEHCFE